MKEKKTYLGEFELMVLMAAARADVPRYGVELAREIESRTGREVSRGSLYVTLDRLEAKGLLRSTMGATSSDRGGRPRRYVSITRKGLTAAGQAHRAIASLVDGIEGRLV